MNISNSDLKRRFRDILKLTHLFALSLIVLNSCVKPTVPPTPTTPPSSSKSITSFVVKAADNPSIVLSDISAVISSDSIKLTLIKGTLVTKLVPSITFTGKSIAPSNETSQNFTNPVKYTVTAEDSSTKAYYVTVRFDSSDKNITSFVFRATDNTGNITTDISGIISDDSVKFSLPSGTRVTGLAPFITITGKSVSPASLSQQDFTNPVKYTVTAPNGTSKDYFVVVSVAPTALFAGTIFLSAPFYNYAGSDSGNIYAIDAATGLLKWSFADNNLLTAESTVSNGLVYNGDRDGYIFALNANTGKLVWKFLTLANHLVYASPIVSNGILYEAGSDASFYALDANTGSLKWKVTGTSGYGSPTISNGIVYTISGSPAAHILALNANTGAVIWDATPSIDTSVSFALNPAVSTSGILYIGSSDEYLYALDANTGKIIWKYFVGTVIDTNPTLSNGTIYFAAGTENFYALDASTGALKWKHYIDLYALTSSPIVANNTVYFGSANHYFYALDADNGNVKWMFHAQVGIASSPLYYHGVIYIAVADIFYALDANTGNLLWQFSKDYRDFTTACAVDSLGNVFHTGVSGEQN